MKNKLEQSSKIDAMLIELSKHYTVAWIAKELNVNHGTLLRRMHQLKDARIGKRGGPHHTVPIITKLIEANPELVEEILNDDELTQREKAAKLGVHPSTLRTFEKGARSGDSKLSK